MSRLLNCLFRGRFARRALSIHKSLVRVRGGIAGFEALEPRVLLSGDLAGNTLPAALDLGSLVSFAQARDEVDGTDTDDFYKFSISDPANVRINLGGMVGNANLQLIQDVNSNGTIDPGDMLGTSSHTGSSNEFVNRRLGAGVYFARVFLGGGGESEARYSLSIINGPNPGDDYEVDGSSLFPSRIVSNLAQVRSLHTITDVDWACFTLTRESDVTVGTWHPRTPSSMLLNGDLEIELFNRDNLLTPIASGSDEAASSSSTTSIRSRLAAGTYLVRISEPGSDARVPHYTLDFRASGVLPVVNDLDGSPSTGLDLGRILGRQTLRGQLGGIAGDQEDYFKFSVTSPIALRLNTLAGSGNVGVDLLDGDGDAITPTTSSGVVSGPVRDSSIYMLGSGDYFIRLSLPEDSQIVTSSAILRGGAGPARVQPLPMPHYAVELTAALESLLGTAASPF